MNYTDSCAPFVVEGIDQSTPGDTVIASVNWVLIGPDTIEIPGLPGESVNIPISEPVDYDVFLTVSDSFLCSSTDSLFVPLNKIDLKFNYNPNACNDTQQSIEFFTDGNFSPFSYQWIFGIGDTVEFDDITDTTVFSISINGIEHDTTFLDSVTVTDNTGCSFTWEFETTVTIPQLSYSDTAGELLCDPQFSIDWLFPISSISTNVDTFIVDFGDGSAGTSDPIEAAQGLTHTYTSVGVFDVTYRVIDTNGCKTEETIDSLVWVQGPEVTPVTEVLEICPLKVQFSLEDTSVVDSVLWFFGDEITSTEFNPTHTYDEVKSYPIKVWAYGTVNINDGQLEHEGCAIEYTTQLIIKEPNVVFSIVNNTDSLCEGEEVDLFNQSINNSLFVIENWIWDFDDQSQGLTQDGPDPVNPTNHLYEKGKAENYLIKLTATTVGGCKAFEYSDSSLFVQPPLELVPQISDNSGCVPLQVLFNPDISGGIDQITNPVWEFGDGADASTLLASHTYTDDGNQYFVNFIYQVGDCTFNADNITTITTFADPIAAFSLNPVTSRNSIISYDIINESTGVSRVEWWLDGLLFSTENQINIPVGKEYQLLVLKAFSSNECEDETELNLKGILVKQINVFTPNGDGINDVLKFELPEKEACLTLTVYDRWGRMVYEDNSYADDWGGKNKNGQDAKDGTYFYSLDVCGDFVLTGYVTIVR